MWQHKQEERELKRLDGDIIKNQRTIRKEMRDFENGEFLSLYVPYMYHTQMLTFCSILY